MALIRLPGLLAEMGVTHYACPEARTFLSPKTQNKFESPVLRALDGQAITRDSLPKMMSGVIEARMKASFFRLATLAVALQKILPRPDPDASQ